MKPGFILLEILLAAAIAAGLGVVLFSSFYQINRGVRNLDTTIDVHTRLALFWQQMGKDIAGVTIPIEATDELNKMLQKDRKEEKKKGEPEAEPLEKKEKKQLKKVFYGDSKDGFLNILTFISNNPLQAYSEATNGKVKPRVVRVVYRLVPEKEQKDDKGKKSYKLLRQESEKLDFEAFAADAQEPIHSYELIGGIKDMKVSYLRVEKQKKDEESATKKEKKSDSWNTDEQVTKLQAEQKEKDAQEKKEKDEEKLQGLQLPQMVEYTFGLWHQRKERPSYFTVRFALIPDFDQAQQQPKEEKKQDKKEEKKEDEQSDKEKQSEKKDEKAQDQVKAQVDTDITVTGTPPLEIDINDLRAQIEQSSSADSQSVALDTMFSTAQRALLSRGDEYETPQ